MLRRPCWVEISTSALEHNYRLLVSTVRGRAGSSAPDSNQPPVELLAIVKADAYGHGLEICAPAVVRAGAHWLGVTSVEEGVAARLACAGSASRPEILVISGPFIGQGAAVIEHGLTAVVWEPWQLDELEAAARTAGCAAGSVSMHLELDTGMSRQGVGAAELDSILENLKQRGSTSPLRIDGLMTHLFAADESDGEVTRAQFAELERLTTRVRQAGFTPTWLNVGNSAAVLSGEGIEILREICNRNEMKAMARPGLAIYGLGPEFAPDEPEAVARLRGELQRVLEWKTEVVSVREIAAGSVVGYNGTFVATEPMRLALLAVGYADGLKRALSNRGWVLVRGEKAPIVGRVSMDQTVVDVTGIATGIAEVAVGDEVVLLGRQAEGDFSQEICVEDHAAWGGTVTWEVFTSIGARVERRAV